MLLVLGSLKLTWLSEYHNDVFVILMALLGVGVAETREWGLVGGSGLLGTCLLRGYSHLSKGKTEAQSNAFTLQFFMESAIMGKG